MTIYEIAALLIVAAMFVLLHWDIVGPWLVRRRLRCSEPVYSVSVDIDADQWLPGGALPRGSLSFIYYRTHDGEESQWPIRADKLDWSYASHFRFARPEEVSRMAAVNALEKMERA